MLHFSPRLRLPRLGVSSRHCPYDVAARSFRTRGVAPSPSFHSGGTGPVWSGVQARASRRESPSGCLGTNTVHRTKILKFETRLYISRENKISKSVTRDSLSRVQVSFFCHVHIG
jgi:hypothetical protein